MECLDTILLHVRMCERLNGKHSQGSQVEVSRCFKYFDQILVNQTLSKLGLFYRTLEWPLKYIYYDKMGSHFEKTL